MTSVRTYMTVLESEGAVVDSVEDVVAPRVVDDVVALALG